MPTDTASAPPSAFDKTLDLQKLRLGDVLLQQGLINAAQLAQTLAQQRQTGQKFGRLLVGAGILTEAALGRALALQLQIPFVNLSTFPADLATVQLLPVWAARRYGALVLEDQGEALLVALSDPLDLSAFDALGQLLQRKIVIAAVADSQLTQAFDRLYRRSDEINSHARALQIEIGSSLDFGELSAEAGQDGAPVVLLLQSLFEDAVQVGASDIHIEPQAAELQIRLRLDGLLQVQKMADKRIAGAIAQRLKLMAGLDISEKRLPQDGRFSLRLQSHTLDVRLSTLPTSYGEAISLRLLSQGVLARRLDNIGMPAAMLRRFREIISRSAGLVLVTGPTGSGKTTTLYAALAEINADELKVITVEDPIEYRMHGITQVQINDKIDLSFGRVLRATLRQDPDVILVGEMRDAETAEIGLRAALTGHLVLSTLHSRDAISTPFRLLDMGVPPFMVATSLQAVIAQRLVRLNCSECASPHQPSRRETAWLNAMHSSGAKPDAPSTTPSPALPTLRGSGCATCNGTGYAGRQGVYELLEMDAELTQAASRADTAAFLQAARERLQGKTLADHVFELVRQGRTSVTEALRIGLGAELAVDDGSLD